MWLNLTIYNQSEVYMAVRQLEFSLLQLTRQVDELLAAVQCMLLGKLPITLVSPFFLHDLLQNTSLHLPENYELAAGTKRDNIHVYYDLIKIALVGNHHSIKMILNIPLKSANQQFSLHKLISLPMRISDSQHIKYLPEFAYFGISTSQRDYILLTGANCNNVPQATFGSAQLA